MTHERLWTQGNKLRVSEGKVEGGWLSPVMGIKGVTYCMEHCMLYANNASWNTKKVLQKVMIHCMVTKIT